MTVKEVSGRIEALLKQQTRFLEANLPPDLTEGQLRVIELLMEREPLKPSELQEVLDTSPAAVTTLLDRMERNGWVTRERDNEDRRNVRIRLTGQGREQGMRGLALREQYWADVLGRLSRHNQRLLAYLLGKVCGPEPEGEDGSGA